METPFVRSALSTDLSGLKLLSKAKMASETNPFRPTEATLNVPINCLAVFGSSRLGGCRVIENHLNTMRPDLPTRYAILMTSSKIVVVQPMVKRYTLLDRS